MHCLHIAGNIYGKVLLMECLCILAVTYPDDVTGCCKAAQVLSYGLRFHVARSHKVIHRHDVMTVGIVHYVVDSRHCGLYLDFLQS